MACCLMAPSHYLNQCWLIFEEKVVEDKWQAIPNGRACYRMYLWGYADSKLLFTDQCCYGYVKQWGEHICQAMGMAWQLAISLRNMLKCSLALLNWCLQETKLVACVWRGFKKPIAPLIRRLAWWPTRLTLVIVAMVTIQVNIDKVEQRKLCDWLRW